MRNLLEEPILLVVIVLAARWIVPAVPGFRPRLPNALGSDWSLSLS
jgi:hypothetical protein